MADYYVKSGATGAANGSSWTDAYTTIAAAAAVAVAGDTVYVSHQHAESTAGVVSWLFPGTLSSPIRVLCVNDGATPPTTLATTATAATTGNNTFFIGNSNTQHVYIYGLTITAGNSTGTASVQCSNSLLIAENCNFVLGGTGSSSRILMNNAGARPVRLKNCTVKFGASGQGMSAGADGSALHMDGCSLASGGTSPTAFFVAGSSAKVFANGLNLTNASAGINLASLLNTEARVTFSNCRLPASWSGALHSGTPGNSANFQLFNTDNGDTGYRYQKATSGGTVRDETTLVRTGGGAVSYKMVTNTNAMFIHPLHGPDHALYNSAVGSAKTLTVEILHDSATNLKDDEVWLEAMYLGTSGVPLGAFVSDAKADVLTTAADQTDSSETWTTTGMANPNTQKLSVTFTPQEAGYIHWRVCVGKASTTLYYDTKAVLS